MSPNLAKLKYGGREMSHKIRASKNYNDEYTPNYILITLLVVGYSCFTIYVMDYIYFIYAVVNHNANRIIPIDIQAVVYIVYLITIMASVLFISYDAKKLNAGFAYNDWKLFDSKTWGSTRWGWLTFLFWWLIFPLYIFQRRQI